MKSKGLVIFLIVLLIVVAGFIVSFMFSLIGGKIHFNIRTKLSEELIVDEVYESNFKNVIVKTDMSDMEIKHSSDGNFKVVIYGDRDRTTVSNDNDTLNIETKAKKCFGFCFWQKSSKVEIYVPEDFAGDIEADNKYGNIRIGEFKNANVKVNADCGDIDVAGAKNADIKNSFGDISLDYAGYANIQENCGDIEVKNVDNITVKNDYGDINIDRVNKFVDAKDSCGNIEIKSLNLERNSRIKNDLGDILIGETNNIYIDASVSLGDIKINNNFRESFVVLDIENSCGDIKVDN